MDVHIDLHRARLARGLSIEDLLSRTALSHGVIKKIDEGRFAELPPGLYARSYVKLFAAEVGVEPGEALANLEAFLPGAPKPLPAMREIKVESDGTLHLQLARISAATFGFSGSIGSVRSGCGTARSIMSPAFQPRLTVSSSPGATFSVLPLTRSVASRAHAGMRSLIAKRPSSTCASPAV